MPNRILITLLWAMAAVIHAATPPVPYLQLGRQGGVTISWRTEASTQSKVKYGPTPEDLRWEAQGACQDLRDSGYEKPYLYHAVALRGLRPDTAYCYQTVSGDITSEVKRFRTPPQEGSRQGHIRFIVLGDHQMPNDRYEKLMAAAKRQILARHGGEVEDSYNLILNDGDQVDNGSLGQYEAIHFQQSRLLSPNLPIMTSVGNHETYGSLGLKAYDAHYFYRELSYRGISSGTNHYYAFQTGRVLFLMLSSEHAGPQQLGWIQRIVKAARHDAQVDWIISVAHRPILAETHIGDISAWLRDQVMPLLSQTPKHVLTVAGHHHLYARGQLREVPTYHMISGAAAWDQMWGQGPETDLDGVQKTLDDWTYQLVDIDVEAREMTVDSYSIGKPQLGVVWDNRHVDHFSRRLDLAPPARPTFTGESILGGSRGALPLPATLPMTLRSSPFRSPAGIACNSTQFQISSAPDFSVLRVDLYRDREDLYQNTGSPDYFPIDRNRDVDLFALTLGAGTLPNGRHFARVRHRDVNLMWSPWSRPMAFQVQGSPLQEPPTLRLAQPHVEVGGSVRLQFMNLPEDEPAWVELRAKDSNTGKGVPATRLRLHGNAGAIRLKVPAGRPGGDYLVMLRSGRRELLLGPPVPLYVGPLPELSVGKTPWPEGVPVKLRFKNIPGFPGDWVGLFPSSAKPGEGVPLQRQAVPKVGHGELSFQGLEKGYYTAGYFLKGGLSEPGARCFFQVGERIGTVQLDRAEYRLGEKIQVTFSKGPGQPKDWVGIYRKGADPQRDYLVTYAYVDGRAEGTLSLPPDKVPGEPGEYFLALFTSDSYTEVSNRSYFRMLP